MWKNGHRCSSLFLAILIPYPYSGSGTKFTKALNLFLLPYSPYSPYGPPPHTISCSNYTIVKVPSPNLSDPHSHTFSSTPWGLTFSLIHQHLLVCTSPHISSLGSMWSNLVSPNCTLFPLCSFILSVHQNTNLFCPFSWWTPHHFPTYEELFFLFKKNFIEAYFTHNSPFPRIQFNDFLSKFTKLYNQHHKSVLEYFIT